MKKYESVFILDIRRIEDDGNTFAEELSKLIETMGGKVIEKVSMGRKQFAREIKKRKAGAYWNHVFSLTAEQVGEIRNKYRLDERVLRMLIINYDRPEQVKSAIDEG